MRSPRALLAASVAASLAASLALVALLAGCATNPVTGKKELALVSESQELDAGKQSLAATEAEYGDYDDARWAARLDSLGQGLAAVSHRPTLKWQFHVIDDATVNAFAAPGGYIFVTRGILADLNSYAQLAGVVGHEIGHVTARHYVRQASRQELFGIGLGVAQAVSPTVAKFGGQAQQGLGILFLKFSRDQETQADELGVAYSFKGRYDPREMPATYHTLGQIADRAGSRMPTYLSTHPDPASREAYAMYAHGAVFAEVKVDPDLGQVRVTRLVGAFGAGRPINPLLVRSQYYGGMVWGVSFALHEEAVVDARSGRVMNADLAGYHIPVNADVPSLEALLIDEHDPYVNPLGIKGVGELSITGTVGAVANAIWHATGARVKRFPIRIEDIVLSESGTES